LSPYAVSKLASEAYLAAFHHCYGLPVLPFRFFNVYGPRQPAGHAYDIPMSSIKSMVGHSLGAIGAIEIAACVLALELSELAALDFGSWKDREERNRKERNREESESPDWDPVPG
ncbi:NAD-dependent epimerase/dehydratase family protein, partial [Streptomyces sp. JV184]|uniref:NAD-dependent epimerase/dehydratase family protein n=1 Tax=Streptomyces sp. JV184 TaxID=858637 RepID=UPI002E7769E8